MQLFQRKAEPSLDTAFSAMRKIGECNYRVIASQVRSELAKEENVENGITYKSLIEKSLSFVDKNMKKRASQAAYVVLHKMIWVDTVRVETVNSEYVYFLTEKGVAERKRSLLHSQRRNKREKDVEFAAELIDSLK